MMIEMKRVGQVGHILMFSTTALHPNSHDRRHDPYPLLKATNSRDMR